MENIQNEHIFAVLGGDLRQTIIAERLIGVGKKVKVFAPFAGGRAIGAEICMTAERAISGSNVIILPLPVSKDNIHLSVNDQSFSETKLCDIIKLAQKHGVEYVLGGMIPDETVDYCRSLGIKVFDYYKCEKLQEKNALPSAEGALMIAMENTDITVLGMNTLVCGYGRIGKKLAYILKRLGARVTVAARRDETLCEAVMGGYDIIKIDSKFEIKDKFDVIFNTVPFVVFTDDVVMKIIGEPIYIEIASKPGGIDLHSAKNKGIRVIGAPSLPGKYSPVSAGEYIFETISDLLEKGGIKI